MLNLEDQAEVRSAARRPAPFNVRLPTDARMAEVGRRGWRGVSARVAEFEGREQYLHDLGAEDIRLLVMLEEVDGHAETRSNPHRPATYGYRGADHISLMPEGFRVWEHTAGARHLRQITITFSLVEMDEDVRRCAQSLSPQLMFSDKRIWKLASLLAAEAESEIPLGPLYGESLGLAIFASLTSQARSEDNSRCGLTPRQLKRVTDYIRENALGSVHLSTLASLAGLSQSHFSRAFKISAGVPPYRWLLAFRAKEAQKLLLDTNMSLAEVALATGFCEQGHFTRAFRLATGTTPAAWRKLHRS